MRKKIKKKGDRHKEGQRVEEEKQKKQKKTLKESIGGKKKGENESAGVK